MKTLLWLDDERNPTSEKWYDYLNLVISCLDAYNIVWVKSYLEFVEYINSNQLPEMIKFLEKKVMIAPNICQNFVLNMIRRYPNISYNLPTQ
jgi:hypothetical protein